MRLRTQILLVLALPALVPMLFIFIRPEPQGTEGLPPEVIESLKRSPAIENAVPMAAPGDRPAPVSPVTLSPITPRLLDIGSNQYIVFQVDKNHAPHPGWIPFTVTLGFYLLLLLFVVLFFHRFDKSIVSLANATRIIAQGNLDTPTNVRGNREIVILAEALEKMRTQLKDANDRKSFLLMGLSHDFRTPITAIKGYVEALQDRIASSPEEAAEFLSIIHGKAVQLEGMVGRWLDLVRLETEDRYAIFQDVNLYDYFVRISRQFSLDARITNHEFEGTVDIPKQWECPMDQDLIMRCLENLFYNAARATPPGGLLGLKVYPGSAGVIVDFWDSGKGIGDSEKSLIWEPFYRGADGNGLGLGLAVVRSIIASHRWTISLVDTPVGALFRIVIPRLSFSSDVT